MDKKRDVRDKGRDTFMGGLSEQIKELALKELAEGKLKSPANFDEVCDRVIRSFRKNPVTRGILKVLGIKDEALRELVKNALTEAGVEPKP